MRKLINNFLLSKWTSRILWFGLGLFFGLGVGHILYEHVQKASILDILKAMSPFAILLSVMLASRQFVYNYEWNKKDAANRALYESQKNISKYMSILGQYIDVREKMRNKITLDIVSIHNEMGVFVKDGKGDDGDDVYKFVFHGDNIANEDIDNIHVFNQSGYIRHFFSNKEGRAFERAMLSLLNEYEYICLSVKKDIFDKETVIDLIGPSIASAYIVFADYISHLRFDGRHGNKRASTYIEIEDMYYEIKEYEDNKYKIPEIKKESEGSEEYNRRYFVPFKMRKPPTDRAAKTM